MKTWLARQVFSRDANFALHVRLIRKVIQWWPPNDDGSLSHLSDHWKACIDRIL